MFRHGAAQIAIISLLTALAPPSTAQVRQPDETLSAGENAGSISDVSRPVGDGLSVHDGAATIGETTGGSMRSGSMRDSAARSMLSGPVSSMSAGPVSGGNAPPQGGSMEEASAGAVKHDIDSPLGERISEPLRELGPLQEQMRVLRQQAAARVAAQASEPVANVDPEVDPEVPTEEIDAAETMPTDAEQPEVQFDTPADEPIDEAPSP